MVLSIVSNSSAAVAQRNINTVSENLSRSISKVSSGSRVFTADEDPAAISIGTGLRVDSAVFRAAQINTAQAVSMLQIADGSLSGITDILVRLQALASQASSDQISNVERASLDIEYQQMLVEVDRIVGETEFNGNALLGGANEVLLNTLGTNVDSDNGFVGFEISAKANGGDVFEVDYASVTQVLTITNTTQGKSQTIYVDTPQVGALADYNFNDLGVKITLNSDFDEATDIVHAGANEEFDVVAGAVPVASSFEFQVGGGTSVTDRIIVNVPVVNTQSLGLLGTDVGSSADALTAKVVIEGAMQKLNDVRSTLGASMNRLEIAAANIGASLENAEAARSALLDVDVAAELTNISSSQALMEAAIGMLAQANSQPQALLGLLR